MTINTKCDNCGKLLCFLDEYAGQRLRCTQCGRRLTVPPASDTDEPYQGVSKEQTVENPPEKNPVAPAIARAAGAGGADAVRKFFKLSLFFNTVLAAAIAAVLIMLVAGGKDKKASEAEARLADRLKKAEDVLGERGARIAALEKEMAALKDAKDTLEKEKKWLEDEIKVLKGKLLVGTLKPPPPPGEDTSSPDDIKKLQEDALASMKKYYEKRLAEEQKKLFESEKKQKELEDGIKELEKKGAGGD